jgi:peptide/nickel transport system substrate-binding protein/oligopeptide transport system substrate-binding protein
MQLRSRTAWLTTGLALLTMSILVFAACGGSSNNGNQTPASDDKQVIRIPLVPNAQDIKRLDPARIGDFYSQQAAMLLFPPLVALDEHTAVQPFAAESLPTVSADGLTYTFKIKSGIAWSDGTPIDANTYAYSLNRSLDPCTVDNFGFFLFAIKGAAAFNSGTCDAPTSATNPVDSRTLIGTSIIAQDAQTLVLTLEKPFAPFTFQLTATQAFAQPRQLIERFGRTEWPDHLADGSGFGGSLFKLTVWDHQGNLKLVRNDSFFGPRPKLREIDIRVYKDADTAYADYNNGRLDQALPPSSQYPLAKTRPDFHEIPYLAIGYIQPNWHRAPFDDLRVRQAFALALDKDSLAHNIRKDDVIATNHIVPQGQYGYNPNLQGVMGASTRGDVQKAHDLITAYANDVCGGDITRCTPVKYETDNTPTALLESQALLGMWQSAMPGYPISVNNVDFNTLLDDIFTQSSPATVPQIFGIGYSLDYPDPNDWLSLQFGATSPNNVVKVDDAQAESLMEQCDSTPNSPQRLSYCNQAEQELVDQVGWIPVNQQKDFWVVSNRVIAYAHNSSGMPSLLTWEKVYITA